MWSVSLDRKRRYLLVGQCLAYEANQAKIRKDATKPVIRPKTTVEPRDVPGRATARCGLGKRSVAETCPADAGRAVALGLADGHRGRPRVPHRGGARDHLPAGVRPRSRRDRAAGRARGGRPLHVPGVNQRVERAKILPQRTHAPSNEIANLCGFCDQSHLTRVFRRHVGVTPARFRIGLS
ncbi:AraC family transcriptional regulator [Saccharopolyspora sp. NPDC050389]|uniref:AraC family transcriptional regulator n=1 Tax=Saccharopolyspora sp. NPDC050389 TaxID=3155516 RepID=UPI0034002B8C